MKILVTYYSQTGNTKQIAEAIFKEAGRAHTAELVKIENISADYFMVYDLVFLGSPILAGGLADPTKRLLSSVPTNPSFKMAAFITHASLAYEKEGFEQGINQLIDICNDKNIEYLGVFDCQGRLTPELHDYVKQAQQVSDEEWGKRMEECDRHPNAEDEEMAAIFAREFISKVN